MRQLFRSLTAPIVLLSSLLCSAQTAPVNQNPPQSTLLTRQAQANYGKLPLTFEANHGQTDPQVKFLTHGSGYSVFLTSGQMVLSLRAMATKSKAAANIVATSAGQNAGPSTNQPARNAVIQLKLVGANPNPAVTGENLQPGTVNYFIGNDPKKWQTKVPLYKQVRYQAVYPGIDLIYYGNQTRVEHDFIVAPGADPSKIQLDVQGVDKLSLAANGDLVMYKGSDEVRLQAPILYQPFHGMQVPVTGQYKVQNSTHVSFTVGQYDKTMPLVIDPVLVYSTFLGGVADDEATAITVDSSGSAYVTGWTQSPNFPLASLTQTPPGGTNIFLAKLDVSGSSLVYADYIGGSNSQQPSSIVLDSSNDAFITGYTYSSDFPTVNPYQATFTGGPDVFITEVAPDGASLVYSTYLGGSNSQQAYGIGLDSTGDIYVAGYTWSTDFPVANAYQPTASPNVNNQYGYYGFLTKLTPDGSTLVYSTYYAGSQNIAQSCWNGSYYTCWPDPYSSISGLAVDATGNAYVAGNTNTYDFPATTGAYQVTNTTTGNQTVGFIGKFDPTGNQLYSSYFEAVPANYYWFNLNALTVDATGSIIIVGYSYPWTYALPLTTPNLCDPTQNNCSYGFITKFDPTGATLVYSTYLENNINDWPQSVTVDANGNAYVFGNSGGGDQTQLVNPVEDYTNGGDVFIEEVDPTGSIQLFSTFLGGYFDDEPGGIALDSYGAIYVAGYTNSTDFPITAAALQNSLGGGYDTFISKIGTTALPAVSIYPSLIQFSIRPVGSVSQPNTSLLRNMGSAPLTITSITTTGDFSETDTCSPGVPAASTCTFTVTFTPTQPGPRFGSIMIEDNGAGSPHFINLVGNGATAVADLEPSSLAFPSLQINQTSSAQTATLTNNGNATMVISNIAISEDYAQTTNCKSSLGIGSSCTFSITFTPTTGGERDGTLSITDNAPGSPHTVALSGSGYVTTATVAPSSLSFSNQAVGSTSTARSVVVTNTGANPITVSAVAASGDFAESDNCTTAPVSTSCTINVTFTPTAAGTRSGTLTISDNAQGNPHTVGLSGTGLAGAANLSASSLTFSALPVGTTSTAQTVTITNPGNGALTVTSVQATGDFAQINNCSTVAASGGTCSIQITFTPTTAGTRTGTLTVTDSASNSPQLVSLSGTGMAGVANLSSSSLTFTALAVGSTSTAQTVTITNPGNGALTFTGIQAIGDFAQTNTCSPVAAVGGTCAIQVTFTPTASGSRAGTLIVADSAANSPQVVSLSGTGLAGTANLSASSLTFAALAVGTTSTAQTVTITNPGNGALAVTSVQVMGDFAQANNCTTVAAGGGTCAIQVTFTPTASGSRAGTLILADSAANSPQVVSLSGTGLEAAAQLSASSLSFTALAVGTASSAQTITVTNSGNAALTVTKVQATGDFAQTNTCSTVAANGGTCAIQVTFTPASSGTRTGTLAVTDSAANSPQLVSLTGSGIDFSMPASGGTATVTAGATATYQLSISPVGGSFSSAISLACAGLPAFSTCTLNPTSVTPGSTTAPVSVSIKTTGTSAQLASSRAARSPVLPWLAATSGLGLFGLCLTGTRRGRRRASLLLLLIVLLAATLILPGCGNSSTTTPPVQKGNSTPPGTYTVLVIGTSGSVQHFSSLTLTVQ